MNSSLARSITVVTVAACTFAVAGCGLSRAVKGGVIGAAAGGALGGVIGNRMGNTAAGAVAGAAIGGTAGAAIGHYMDRQAAEMAAQLDSAASIARVGEGIKVTFGSGVLFQTASSDLTAEARANIVELARILGNYPDTEVLIEGHTDSDGSDAYNQTLSERRANAVYGALTANGVPAARLRAVGYGESQPIVSNDTPANKAANRRVDLLVLANEKLKADAAAGTIR